MRRRIFLVAWSFGLVWSLGISGQDSIPGSMENLTKGHFLSAGVSGGWFAVKDLETSPLIYKGFLPGFQLGGLFYGKYTKISLDYNFSFGSQVTRNYPAYDSNTASAYNNCLDMGVSRKINHSRFPQSDIYLGLNVGVIANFRNNPKYENANFNYEGFVTLGPVMSWEKEKSFAPGRINLGVFRWPFYPRKIKWIASLYVPLVNAAVRPPYTTIGDFVDGVSPSFRLNQLKVVSFTSMVNVVSTVGVHYFLQNGKRLELSYRWYYYNYYPAFNQVKGVAGFFSFSFLFRLNKSN